MEQETGEKTTATGLSADVIGENTTQPTAYFATAAEALKAAAPPGSRLSAVGYENTDAFLRMGYRTVERDADVVIARGGEREFELGRRRAARARLILVPARDRPAAAASVYRTLDDAFAVIKNGVRPFGAVFDPAESDPNLASLFGEIVSLDLCAFDMTFGSRMRGERPDIDVVNEVAGLVEKLTTSLSPVVKDAAEAARLLTDAGKKAAEIVSHAPALLHSSGAAQTAEAVRMLYAAEDRQLGMRGEIQMLIGAYIIDFYMKNLIGGELDFPPDNNKRIDSVCEYFHTDVRRACIHASPVYPPLKMRLCEYRRNEFRAEQTKMLAAVHRRQSAAWNVFKRLYPDDGYSLKSLIDKPDIGICLALAPDVFAADSMLSFLKQTGKLDAFLV